MSRSSLAVSKKSQASSGQPPDETSAGNVYTMAEAARLKGVSYHTVSRAVRRGKLPARRLGRMALISADDLRAWRPMRERAPLKYRRREPNPDATPALLDLASEERVELAERLSLLFEIIHGAASDLPQEAFLSLLADRMATALDLRRVAIWEFAPNGSRATRVAAFGPAISEIPEAAATSEAPALAHAATATSPALLDVNEAFTPDPPRKVKRGAKVFVTPLRSGKRTLGAIVGDQLGTTLALSAAQLSLAQGMASQAAVALDCSRMQAIDATHTERLESAHRRLLAVVDQLPQGVVIVDAPNGHLILANRAAEELWGAPLPEAGANALGLADGKGTLFARDENPLSLTMSSGQGRIGETLMLTRADGSRVTVLANHAPVVDAAGRIMGAVSVLQNVAQLRALDRAKDEFLSVAAHELRNPLTSLHGNLQLLLRHVQKDSERAEDATRLEAIISQSDRLAQLVGRLLDVSRAELGRLDLEIDNADAAAIVRRVVDGARGLSTTHRIRGDAPESVLVTWDAIRIEQVLTNLVGNAVKYTPGGDVVVTLEEASGDLVRISVRDHGPGIRNAAKSNLFERYVRANGDIQSEGDGLGLGLYISRLIARAHGGDLTLHDAAGGGALFVIAIPRRADVSGTIQLHSTTPA